jgi:hypothetical protein
MQTPNPAAALLIAASLGLFVGAAPTATAAPPGAIPVFCARGVAVDVEQIFTCRRADTRGTFMSVPAGMHFHVTDIHTVPNYAVLTGSFAALIGRDDADEFPTFPSLDITGTADRVNALHFTTPYIILHEGESLAVANFSHSDYAIDVYVAGYLATQVSP